ncbi:MFS transporter [Xenorhabdus thuongxuanensis]|uniref:LmrA n=1 Tax=Xenorhabdus thuongxuanensis TaxID=1873484 RepID=A0A1Q5U7T3_9GAMM|nr:MFS transporter [Xenorhabdus thuongxuanensis]OKP08528.1 LmrA [Xenorhabdus thuongxuanensis]
MSRNQGDHQHRLGLSLALLAFAQLIISLDINIVFVALPEIGKGLGFSDQTLQWVVSAYTVFCGGFLLFGGRAADLLGQRRMFIGALWLYAISSLIGGMAWRPEVIIAARAVQGIGGAFLFPATLSLINRLFREGPERNRALAVWGGAGASGLTIGSLAGGLLTNYLGWSSVFYVNVLLAGIAIIAAFIVISADPVRHEKRSFDLPGALTVTVASTLLVFSLVQGPEYGWGTPVIKYALLLALVSLIMFIVIESKSRDPLMPLRLFRNKNLVVGVTITFIYMGTFGALPYFETVLFQNVMNYNALETGLAFIVPSISIFMGTQAGARLANSIGTKNALITGCIIGIVGTLLMMPGASVSASYKSILAGLIISGLGQGIVWTAMWIAAATDVDHSEQGITSGMASTTLNVGNAIGLAILIALATGIAQRDGPEGETILLAASIWYAFLYAAIGIALALLITLTLPRRKILITSVSEVIEK